MKIKSQHLNIIYFNINEEYLNSYHEFTSPTYTSNSSFSKVDDLNAIHIKTFDLSYCDGLTKEPFISYIGKSITEFTIENEGADLSDFNKLQNNYYDSIRLFIKENSLGYFDKLLKWEIFESREFNMIKHQGFYSK